MSYRSAGQPVAFAAAIFAGAFLLFQVQPLLGKYILPWFGGSPAVWTVCMLFFQAALFLGYAYAHAMVRFLGLKGQVAVHLALLVAAILLLPIAPEASWRLNAGSNPSWRILLLLTTCVGLPYFLLSATSPLLQSWFSRACPQQSPYRLYALSNFGSLLALVSYPFVVEPALNVQRQTDLWSWAFVVFALLTSWAAWRAVRRANEASAVGPPPAVAANAARPGYRRIGLWFALAMCPSVLLLATTDQLCVEVAVVPFLWVLPLTLYLLSFILCFHSLRWCPRSHWALVWGIATALVIQLMIQGETAGRSLPMGLQIGVYGLLLMAGSMVCHGELVRLQPAPAYLTTFYLTMSAGGVAGGILVGLVAPLLFLVRVELPLAITGGTLLVLLLFFRDPDSRLYRGRQRTAWLALAGGVLALSLALGHSVYGSLSGAEILRRNFYGVLAVKQTRTEGAEPDGLYQLVHGCILHGSQFVSSQKRNQPTSYYGPESGVGLLLREHTAARKVGTIGLGVGTLAAYGQAGDSFRFYEINPDVVELAERFFHYLPHCRARVEVLLGDARLCLEQEPPQDFDLLVLDAFSGDAIPVHLLTREAFAIYWKHLRPDGILAVHISNRHLDLRPVVNAHTQRDGLHMLSVRSKGNSQHATQDALWCLLSRQSDRLPSLASHASVLPPEQREVVWTDNRNSLFDVLIWSH